MSGEKQKFYQKYSYNEDKAKSDVGNKKELLWSFKEAGLSWLALIGGFLILSLDVSPLLSGQQAHK